jgi:hypothetical protein
VTAPDSPCTSLNAAGPRCSPEPDRLAGASGQVVLSRSAVGQITHDPAVDELELTVSVEETSRCCHRVDPVATS